MNWCTWSQPWCLRTQHASPTLQAAGGELVVMSKLRSLGSNSLKEVVDEAVHDAHGFGRDTSVRVDLLQHLVDVDCVRLLPLPLALLLVALGNSLGGLASSFARGFGRHFKVNLESLKKCYQAV